MASAPSPLERPVFHEAARNSARGDRHGLGSRNVFAAANFTQVSHPSLRRVVMRIDFPDFDAEAPRDR